MEDWVTYIIRQVQKYQSMYWTSRVQKNNGSCTLCNVWEHMSLHVNQHIRNVLMDKDVKSFT
jgi:hypothetical protein